MNDAMSQLNREPRPSLRPFFSSRTSAAVREQQSLLRRRWLFTYWVLAILASIVILFSAPGSSVIARSATPALVPVIVITAMFYRRKLRRLALSLFR